MPKAGTLRRAVRDESIIREWRGGKLQREIARHFGISERRVRYVIRRITLDEQAGLFDLKK